MSDFDANPFASPFSDSSVTQATTESQKPTLDDFNPFGGSSIATDTSPAVVVPSGPPPSFNNYGSGSLSAPPVAAPKPPPVIPGHDELLQRQEELEKKAEELQRKERDLTSGHYPVRESNWPPMPKCCPVGPCFYQNFDVDIPNEFRWTVRMLYYLWIFYAVILFNNIFVCLAIFIVDNNTAGATEVGPQFGLSMLWFILNVPLSLCWYRPVYKAFRSDSSFNFFVFFFIMFFQVTEQADSLYFKICGLPVYKCRKLSIFSMTLDVLEPNQQSVLLLIFNKVLVVPINCFTSSNWTIQFAITVYIQVQSKTY